MLKVFDPVETDRASDSTAGDASEWSGIDLKLVVNPGIGVYLEWAESEPWENVIAMMHFTERGSTVAWRVVFDPNDEDMWEVLPGGHRLHGMFVKDMI